jgi:hypothetical protein
MTAGAETGGESTIHRYDGTGVVLTAHRAFIGRIGSDLKRPGN